MPELDCRADIYLESLRRVAWKGEPVILSDAARERIAAARRTFLGYLEAYPERRVHGANTRVGRMGRTWKRSMGSSGGKCSTPQPTGCRCAVPGSTRKWAGADGMSP